MFICAALQNVLKDKTKMGAGAPRGGYSGAGKKAGEIQNINTIGEIGCFDLQTQTATLFPV
jgi:hypothetical protein